MNKLKILVKIELLIKLLSVYNFDLSMSDLFHGSLPEVQAGSSFVVLHQKLAWTLCNNLYYMLYICIYHGGPICNFTNFLSCKSTNSTYIKNKCRINYLIYRIVQKYFIHLIIF